MTDDLLTEPEVAEMLRCSREKIKRLRLGGKLTYIKGRPILIRRQDVDAYLSSVTRPATGTTAQPSGDAGADLDIIEQIKLKRAAETKANADARDWALKKLLLKRDKSVGKRTAPLKTQKPAETRAKP
jgi:excisionase family DNA binding protein